MIKQTLAILFVNLRSIPSRIAPSFIIVVGIGGVVAVLVSLLSMARGFESTVKNTGRDDRALVLRAGSTSEVNGNIPINQFGTIRNFPGVSAMDDTPLAAMETFVTVNVPQRNDSPDAGVPMRGIGKESFLVRPEVNIISGRSIEFGKYELIAGISAANQFVGIDLNETVKIRGIDWLVVGIFLSSGGAYESELWVDERLLAASWNRGDTFSSVLVQLSGADMFSEFEHLIESDRRLTVHAVRESEYYARQSENTTNLIRGVGLLIGLIMAVGAIFAALNSMYAALSNRTSEIATMRALGFSQTAILFSVLIESALLGAIGAGIGGSLVYFALNDVGLSNGCCNFCNVYSDRFQIYGDTSAVGFGSRSCNLARSNGWTFSGNECGKTTNHGRAPQRLMYVIHPEIASLNAPLR